jgi:hypothetical protein
MIVADAAKAALAQRRRHGICVRAPHLVIGDRIARLDQLITGRHHHDGRLAADPHARHAG